MLGQALGLLSTAILIMGAGMLVFGIVQVGLSIKDGAGGSGIAQGIGWIVGGAVIIAGAAWFKTIPLGVLA